MRPGGHQSHAAGNAGAAKRPQRQVVREKARPRLNKANTVASGDDESEDVLRAERPDEKSMLEQTHDEAHALGWNDPERLAEEKKEAKEEAHEAEERKEGEKPGAAKGQGAAWAGQESPKPPLPARRAEMAKSAFEGAQKADPAKSSSLTGRSLATPVSALKAAAQIGDEAALKHPKQPDAFTLLHAAQDKGVFYKEDYEAHGQGPEAEDPELKAAVEEATRLLFDTKGVMRIAPGTNDAQEKVVVIVAGMGFGEASLAAIPEKVHRFATLLALPYDLLPLKKER